MTCSSSTIFTAKRLSWGAAAPLVAWALVLVPVATHAESGPAAALIVGARRALARGDGIDAEMKLREAVEKGVPPYQVAAFLGGAYLQQGDRARARRWLGPATFSRETAAEGLRLLAQLDQQEGDLVAADRAYKRALMITPRDVDLRVEIGRLRYRQGLHVEAIRIADHAIRLDPRNVRALEFQAQLVRDRHGLLASLPWFEKALTQAPQDVSVLGGYAATLGEAGRAKEMLVVTRRMLQVSPGNPQAYYLQAVLAARAARYDLARSLMARTRGKLETSGAMLLEAVLELSAGNTGAAAELCEALLKRDPELTRARELLARSLYLSGQHRYLTLRFRDDISSGSASPYLLTLAARAYESQGEREQAGALLDRAALPGRADLRVVPQGSAVGTLMAQGRSADALATAERDRKARPGSYRTQSLAGDVFLALGRGGEAQQRYAAAAQIRMSDSLLLRRFQAYQVAGDLRGATQMVDAWLTQNPGDQAALRLRAMLLVQSGDPLGGARILDHLRHIGSNQDVQLLTDLSLLQLRSGTPRAAVQVATRAYHLQRTSPLAAQALALSYATLGVKPAGASAWIEKARQMLGDNPVLAEAVERLRQQGRSGSVVTRRRVSR